MSISVIKFTRPKLYLSLVAGGTLSVGQTYYFMGIVSRGGGYYGESNSRASEQKSITPTSGNQSIKIEWFQDGGDITSFADAGGGDVTVTTSSAHGRSNSDTVYIRGTTNYDGSYTISNASGSTFDITHSWDGDDGASEWFADNGVQDEADGIIFKWDKYDMIDSGDGEPYQWINLNDPANSGKGEFDERYGHRRWSHLKYNGNFSGTEITFTKEETSLESYGLMDGIAIDSNRVGSDTRCYFDVAWRKTIYPLDSVFAQNKGKLAVVASGAGNTIATLKTALEDSGYDDMYVLVYGDNNFADSIMIVGSFFSEVDSETEFNDSEITMVGGVFHQGSYSWGDVVCNRCYISNNALTYYARPNPEGEYNNTVYAQSRNYLHLDNISTDSVGFTPKCSGPMLYYYQIVSGVNLIGIDMDFFQWRNQRENANSSMTDVYIKNFYVYIVENGSGDYTGHMTRVEFENEGLKDYDVSVNWNKQDGDADKIMECLDVTCNRSGGKIKVYCGNEGSKTWTDTWNMRFDVNLTILDENGNAIENAIVGLSWDGGSDSDTADSNGEATVRALSYQLTHSSADGVGYYTTSDYKTLTLTIQMSGYETYTWQGNIKAGATWEITLLETKHHYHGIMQHDLRELFEHNLSRPILQHDLIEV